MSSRKPAGSSQTRVHRQITAQIARLRGVRLAVAASALIACGNDQAPGLGIDAGRMDVSMDAAPSYAAVDASACSTGPVYSELTQFAQGHGEGAAVPCIPHCGAGAPVPWTLDTVSLLYPVSALPSGACDPRTLSCEMNVGYSCNGTPAVTWSAFVCSCVGGSWSCVTNYKGGGSCRAMNVPVDAQQRACDDLINPSTLRITAAADAADKTCANDGDCVVVSELSNCSGDFCSAAVLSDAGVAAVQRVIDDENATTCAAVAPLLCLRSVPPCAPIEETPHCVGGQCRWVVQR